MCCKCKNKICEKKTRFPTSNSNYINFFHVLFQQTMMQKMKKKKMIEENEKEEEIIILFVYIVEFAVCSSFFHITPKNCLHIFGNFHWKFNILFLSEHISGNLYHSASFIATQKLWKPIIISSVFVIQHLFISECVYVRHVFACVCVCVESERGIVFLLVCIIISIRLWFFFPSSQCESVRFSFALPSTTY